MAAGKLTERVTFQRQSGGADIYGNTSDDWQDILTVWADVLERLGREVLAAGRLEAPKTATIRVRRSSASLDLTEADRVVARGQVWNIRSIVAVGRSNEMLEVLCEAQVAV